MNFVFNDAVMGIFANLAISFVFWAGLMLMLRFPPTSAYVRNLLTSGSVVLVCFIVHSFCFWKLFTEQSHSQVYALIMMLTAMPSAALLFSGKPFGVLRKKQKDEVGYGVS